MTDCCSMVLLIKIKNNNNTNVHITRLTILISKEKNKKKFIKELHLQLTFQTKHTHNINEQSLTKGIHKWLTTICITINVYVSRLRSLCPNVSENQNAYENDNFCQIPGAWQNSEFPVDTIFICKEF